MSWAHSSPPLIGCLRQVRNRSALSGAWPRPSRRVPHRWNGAKYFVYISGKGTNIIVQCKECSPFEMSTFSPKIHPVSALRTAGSSTLSGSRQWRTYSKYSPVIKIKNVARCDKLHYFDKVIPLFFFFNGLTF